MTFKLYPNMDNKINKSTDYLEPLHSYYKFTQSHILETAHEKKSVFGISVPDATPNFVKIFLRTVMRSRKNAFRDVNLCAYN